MEQEEKRQLEKRIERQIKADAKKAESAAVGNTHLTVPTAGASGGSKQPKSSGLETRTATG